MNILVHAPLCLQLFNCFCWWFSVPVYLLAIIFELLTLNQRIYSVNLRIQSEYRKIRSRNNSVFEYFSCSVYFSCFITTSRLIVYKTSVKISDVYFKDSLLQIWALTISYDSIFEYFTAKLRKKVLCIQECNKTYISKAFNFRGECKSLNLMGVFRTLQNI